MTQFEGEYSGASLQSFILALGHSQQVVERVLRSKGLERIDPDRWYELNFAISIYDAVAAQIGEAAVAAVGEKIIEAAAFPPAISDVKSVLASLDAAWHMNARGPSTGSIETTFDDERSATITWAIPGPCALNVGIIQGCCRKFGAEALVEHGGTGCVDRGDPACIYRVSW